MIDRSEVLFDDVRPNRDHVTLRVVKFENHFGFDLESTAGSAFADASREELIEAAYAMLEIAGETVGELLESEERPLIINNYHGDIYY